MVAQAISGVPERPNKPSAEAHQADVAGNAILILLQKATTTTEEMNRRVAEVVDKVIDHLRLAEDRIVSLQAEVRLYRESSERAENGFAGSTTRLSISSFKRLKTSGWANKFSMARKC